LTLEKNSSDIAEKICFLLENTEKISEYGNNARSFIEDRYNQNIQMEKLYKIISS
jgi:glycosyltransferase involved in cell wall biosynthesis